jgi:hypothetical protein
MKFLIWAEKNSDRIKSKMQRKPAPSHDFGYQPMVTIQEQGHPTDARDDDDGDSRKYQLNQSNHLAANLYILNHRLQKVLKNYPFRPPVIVTPSSMKKLCRRPSFESLGQQQKDAEGRCLSRDDSFASSGSLKNSASVLSLTGSMSDDPERLGQANHLTPEQAEEAAVPTVEHVLGFVKPIIPPIPPPRMSASLPDQVVSSQNAAARPPAPRPAPAPSAAYQQPITKTVSYAPQPAPAAATHQPMQTAEPAQVPPPAPQPQVVYYHHAPPPVMAPAPAQPESHPQQIVYHQYTYQQGNYYTPAPGAAAPPPAQNPMDHRDYAPQAPAYAPVPSPLDHVQYAAAPPPVVSAPQMQNTSGHVRKSSFLPSHLNVVPEDLYSSADAAAEDFFVGLMDDEDWAIGEGVDMDTTS